MRFAKEMATIRLDVPDIILDMEEARVGRYDRQRVLDLLRDLEFRTLVPRLPSVDDDIGPHRNRAAACRTTTSSSPPKRSSTRWSRACARPGASPSTSSWSAAARTTRCSSASRRHRRSARPTTYRSATRWRSAARTQLEADQVLEKMAPLFGDAAIEKVAHNGKFDIAYLEEPRHQVHGFAFDTLLAAYLLGDGALADSGRSGAGSMSLKWLVSRRMNFEMREIIDLIGKAGAKQLAMDQTLIDDALHFACENVDCTLRLRRAPRGRAEEAGHVGALRRHGDAARARAGAHGGGRHRHGHQRPARDVGRPQRADRLPGDEGLRRRRAPVQPRLAAAALAGAVRGDRPAEDAQDEAGLLDRRAVDRRPARRPPDHRHDPALA